MTTVVPQMERQTSDASRKYGRFFAGINFPFLITVMLLVLFGLVDVSFVIADSSDYSISRQILGVILGIIVMIIVWKIDYRVFADMMVPLLILDVVLILSPHLPVIGHSAGGATSWVKIGITFQPGELAKAVTVLLMASMVSRYYGMLDNPREYIKCLIVMMVPFVCILTQPDLGTGIVLLVIGITIIYEGGASGKFIGISVGVLAALIVAVIALDPVFDNLAGEDVFLKDYQMNRLLVFIDADLDPTGSGYNLQQAKIAIGSGGFLGKGLGNATQSALGFLPEAATDFVFCTVAEQLGFVGVVVLLALFGSLFYQAIKMAKSVSTQFGRLIIMGICGMWLFQVLENIGMTCGLMPITGIPLPFISYGSSSMITNFVCVGLILSVWSKETGFGKPPSVGDAI